MSFGPHKNEGQSKELSEQCLKSVRTEQHFHHRNPLSSAKSSVQKSMAVPVSSDRKRKVNIPSVRPSFMGGYSNYHLAKRRNKAHSHKKRDRKREAKEQPSLPKDKNQIAAMVKVGFSKSKAVQSKVQFKEPMPHVVKSNKRMQMLLMNKGKNGLC